MSEFEYLRNLPLGQVVPGDSPIHRLDPRTRILIFVILLAAILFTGHPLGLILALAALVGGLLLARLPLGYALRSLLPPLPFLLILAVLQVFFNALPNTGVVLLKLGPVIITLADLLAGATLLLRFSGMVLGLSFSSQVISTSELAHGLERLFAPLERVRLPVHDGVMAMVVAVRFLPFLAQSAERIAKAQAARGAEWTRPPTGRNPIKRLWRRARALLPLLVPVFVTSLRRADTMALAMDARGYASRTHPTSLIEMHFKFGDGVAMVIAVLLAIAILFV